MSKFTHDQTECYCDLFEGEGMPEGAICKPCFQDGCECMKRFDE